MNVFTTASRIIITCNNRLAPYLQQEVTDLGFTIVRSFATGVELQGTMNDCVVLNLNLRCASQVLYSLKTFACASPDELYNALLVMPWEQLFLQDGYFSVTSNVNHHSINNELFANVKVKDAIVDRFRNKKDERPNSGPNLDGVVVHLFWRGDTAEIFLDSSGETLAKHGYRKIPGKAPMLEALAAATLLATSWDRRSPFVNPMCGSGTLAIEAALLATNRRPGLFRSNYSFKHIIGFDIAFYTAQRKKLTDQIIEVPGLRIIATDNRQDAIDISKVNAGVAGVEDLLEFDVCDFTQTHVPQDVPGAVYFNPEYGERLGEEVALQETYAQLGDFMKQQCKGYMGYIFTGNLNLAKKIGLKPKRRIEFYTGKIDCRLFEYELYAGTRRTDKPAS